MVFVPVGEGGLSKPAAGTVLGAGDRDGTPRCDQSEILNPEEAESSLWASPSHHSKGLILAQNERWRRGLGMQVVRAARPVAQG